MNLEINSFLISIPEIYKELSNPNILNYLNIEF